MHLKTELYSDLGGTCEHRHFILHVTSIPDTLMSFELVLEVDQETGLPWKGFLCPLVTGGA